jgi:hypothetical protein
MHTMKVHSTNASVYLVLSSCTTREEETQNHATVGEPAAILQLRERQNILSQLQAVS